MRISDIGPLALHHRGCGGGRGGREGERWRETSDSTRQLGRAKEREVEMVKNGTRILIKRRGMLINKVRTYLSKCWGRGV